jgi:hypothetical protein
MAKPRKVTGQKIVRLPKTERCVLLDNDDFVLTIYCKGGNKPTNAFINWALDRGKKAIHE